MITFESKYTEFLFNKEVLLAGPNGKHPPYEVLVGVNNHLLASEQSCDIIYHNCNPNCPVWELAEYAPFSDASFVIGNSLRSISYSQHDFLEALCHKKGIDYLAPPHAAFLNENPIHPRHEWLNTFHKQYDFKPFTGVIAIKHLLQFPLKRLFITGMNLYHNGIEFPKKRGPHEIAPHIRYFKDILETDSRVVIEDEFRRLLYSGRIAED